VANRSDKVRRYVRQYRQRKDRIRRKKVFWFPIRLAVSLVVVVGGAFLFYQVYHALNSPLTTVTALSATVNDEISMSGYFFRNEHIIEAEHEGTLLYLLDDGDKIGKYDAYAATYANARAVEIHEEIEALDAHIASLTAAVAAGSDTNSAAAIAEQIVDQLLNNAEGASTGQYSRLSSYASQLKTLIVNREFAYADTSDLTALVEQLKARRSELQSQVESGETVLYSPRAGFFVSAIDGYENLVEMDALRTLKPEDLEQLDSRRESRGENAVGKVVSSFDWYFAAVLPEASANRLVLGSNVTLCFDATGDELIRAKVYSLSTAYDGKVTVVFYSTNNTPEYMRVRKQAASVILKTYSGLKVPKSTVRVDSDGQVGVYVITGLYAEFKPIEILYETRDYYIVATDPSKTNSLLKNDEIIQSGKNLSDRKVIK